MFEQRILELCDREGLDQTKLGTNAKLSRDTVSKWVRLAKAGELQRTGKMDQLAKHYGVSVDWLFGAAAAAPAAGDQGEDAKRWAALVALREDGTVDLAEAIDFLQSAEFDRSKGPPDALQLFRLVKRSLRLKKP